MGERGGGEAAPASAAERLPRGPLLAMALGTALLVVLAVAPKPVLDAEGAANLLAAQSLACDGDRLWMPVDDRRSSALVSSAELAADAMVPGEGERFGGPAAYLLFLAPWAALAGARGALLAQGLLFGAAALFAAVTLARHVGRGAAWLPVVLLFASASGAYVLRLWPETLLAALLLLAFALARNAHAALPPVFAAGLPDLYPEEPAARGGRFAPRWIAVGALLGAVASAAPWMLPLLWPAAAAVPASRRRAGVAWLLAGAAATLLLLAVVGAATAGARPSPRGLLAGLGWGLPPAIHPRVLGWDVVYVLAGRHLGLLFYFAPVVLFAFLGGRGKSGGSGEAGRRAMWGGALLSLALLMLLQPFGLAGSPLALGLRAAVPLAAVLALAVARPPSRWVLLLTCAWAAAWLWPLWKSPRHPFTPRGELRYAAPYLAPWSPLETTQTSLRFGSRLRFGRGRLTLLGGEALPGSSVAAVPAGEWVELLAAIPGSAPGFWVDGGEQAGNELPVRGGEVTETIFRPDGGISFLVRPRRTAVRHGMPGDDRLWSFQHVSVRLPGPPGKRFTIRMRPG